MSQYNQNEGADVKSITCTDFADENMIKILNLKSVIMLEYQNIKIFSEKFTLKTDQNRLLRLKKFKKTVP